MGTQKYNQLSALKIQKAAPGTYEDGGGLRLVKTERGGKWVYRYSFFKRRREMGLGAWPQTTLKQARALRDHWRQILQTGLDPIEQRAAARIEAQRAAESNDPTFTNAAQRALDVKSDELRDGGHAGRWISPLEHHIFPLIGDVRVSELSADHITAALKPIWKAKHPTAIKARNRIKITLKQARIDGLAVDESIVDTATARLGYVHHVEKKITATPWREMPDLYAALQTRDAMTARCLQFLILTVVRTKPARLARASEIRDTIWTIPGAKMKSQRRHERDFRVPLSGPAQQIAREHAAAFGETLFPGARGAPLTDIALHKLLDRMSERGRPHGFRSAFSTWAAETRACDQDIREMVLAHSIESDVGLAYQRSDLIELRRDALEKWAAFVTREAHQ